MARPAPTQHQKLARAIGARLGFDETRLIPSDLKGVVWRMELYRTGWNLPFETIPLGRTAVETLYILHSITKTLDVAASIPAFAPAIRRTLLQEA